MKTPSVELIKHDASVTTTPPHGDSANDPKAQQLAFDLESVQRKLRADSFFHQLTLEQRQRLLKWFGENDSLWTIHKKIAASPPEGFGLDVHVNSLQRLRAWLRAQIAAGHHREALDTIHDLEKGTDFSQTTRIQQAINQLLHQRAFELARNDPDSREIRAVLASIEKLSALELKRQKLLLDHQRNTSPGLTSTHHRVELSIAPAQTPNIINLPPSPTALPDVQPPGDQTKPPRSDAVTSEVNGKVEKP